MQIIKADAICSGSRDAYFVHESNVHQSLVAGDAVSTILSPTGDLLLYRGADHTLHSARQTDAERSYVALTPVDVKSIVLPKWATRLADVVATVSGAQSAVSDATVAVDAVVEPAVAK